MTDIEEYKCTEWGETRACLEVRCNVLETAFTTKVYKVGTVKCETIANRVMVNDNPNPAPDEAHLGDTLACVLYGTLPPILYRAIHFTRQSIGGEHSIIGLSGCRASRTRYYSRYSRFVSSDFQYRYVHNLANVLILGQFCRSSSLVWEKEVAPP